MTLIMNEPAQRHIDNGSEALCREQSLSSPLVSASGIVKTSKPKKKPTVTPRTFTRFFTPRSSFGERRPSSYSRHALLDITCPAINRHAKSTGRKRLNFEPFPDIVPLGDENEWSRAVEVKRRRILVSPDTTVDGSSPIKPRHGASSLTSETPSLRRADRATSTETEERDQDTDRDLDEDVVTKPGICPRIWTGLPGRILGRSLSNGQLLQNAGNVDHCGC